MDGDVISVEHLTKRYGSVIALDDVSFRVAESEVVGLLGPNGAGKTTTIEILEGMRAPSEGRVRVLGHDPLRAGRRLKNRVGIVLQSAGIDAMLTVSEVVQLYASFYRPRRPPREVIAEVGLEESASIHVGQLSGGQRRLVDLALALLGAPSLLFLDEPTTGLDPAARRQTWSLIGQLREAGVAIVMTSHYLDEVQQLADRVVILSRGRIVGEGQPGALAGLTPSLARISFRLASGVELPAGPWETQLSVNGMVTLTTMEPVEAARILIAWATEHSLDLDELEIKRPSLEDEYLKLTSQR